MSGGNHPPGAGVSIVAPLPLPVDLSASSIIAISGSSMPPNASFYSSPYATSGVVKATSGTWWIFYAANQTNADLWLLIWNLAAVPAAATKSDDFVQVPRRNNGEAYIAVPRLCNNGIVWAASSRPDELVVVAGAPLLVRGRYT